MDDSARERYRERVRRDNPMSLLTGQHRVIEDLLARVAELDAHVAGVVRGLDPDGMRAFLDVLTMMRAAAFRTVPGGGGETDYAGWFGWLYQNAAAGKVAAAQRPAIDRMTALIGLSERSVLLRQLDPACPPAAAPVRTGPDAGVLEAAQPLFDRYSAAQPRIGIGTADEALDAELSELLASYRQLRDEQQPRTGNWMFLQWWCAAVTGSLARSAAIQRRAAAAVGAFNAAAAEWNLAGQPAQAADCLTRAAEVALADGADVDEALGPLLRELAAPPDDGAGRAGAPTIGRARLLARVAQIYLDAGDHFDAGTRAAESARMLAELGFADPAGIGVPAAFAAWVEADPGTDMGVLAANRTQALLSAVTEIWSVIVRVRMALTPAAPGDPGVPGTELLRQLAELAGELGAEAQRVAGELAREAEAFGMPAAPDGEQARRSRKQAGERQSELLKLDLELNTLLDEFASCTDAGQLQDLLARTEALAARIPGANPAGPGATPAGQDGTAAGQDGTPAGPDGTPAGQDGTPVPGNSPGLGGTAATASVLRSDILVQLGRVGDAAAVLAAARDRLTADPGLAEAERRSLLVTVIGRAAMAEARRGDFGRMSQLCGEGIAEVELDRDKVNGPYLQDGYLRFRGLLYDWGVFAAQRAGDDELALARSELAKARGVLGWAVAAPGSAPDDAPADAHADEEAFHALTASLASTDPASTDPASTDPASTDPASTNPASTNPASADPARIAAERRVVWDRLMTRRSRSARRLAPPAFTLAALRASLAPDEAVITYHWLSRATLLITTIDASSAVTEKVTLDDTQRARLDGVAADIGLITQEAPWLERECRRLGALLLPRDGRGLLAGKRRLVVSPHRVLHQLPFHAFGFDGAPLADRFAVSYAPNLTSMLLPAPAAGPGPGTGPGPVLALGVSSFAGRKLAPLPNAAPEAAAVAALYEQAGVPVTLLTDGQAGATRIRELRERGTLAGFGTLHLVTHGDDIPVAEPFDAGLYLPAGRIDGLEISQWQLRADLVVLSACYSARRAISGRRGQAGAGDQGEELFGDEVLGLQAAFFAAGARQLLGALWPVADGSARALMCAFHRQLAAGLVAESALRQAMLDVRATNLPMYHWAPYKLVRLGRAPQRTETRSQEGSRG